jgi:hypothetical protein
VKTIPFKVWSATTTGPSHTVLNAPCQDSCSIAKSSDGSTISIVVSDGCGSAQKSEQGSLFISEYISSALLALSPELIKRGPGEWLIDKSVMILAELRETMRRKYGDDIRDYAATIVAALVSDLGGFLLHVGDGVATSFAIKGSGAKKQITLVAQSNPENGEFANQTFYITEPDWIRHIRITPLAQVDCLVLNTDGAQALFYEGNQPFSRAFSKIFNSLSDDEIDAEKYLRKTLTNSQADALSGDDKTFAILARPEFFDSYLKLENHEILVPDAFKSEISLQNLAKRNPFRLAESKDVPSAPANALSKIYARIISVKKLRVSSKKLYCLVALVVATIIAVGVWLVSVLTIESSVNLKSNTEMIIDIPDEVKN